MNLIKNTLGLWVVLNFITLPFPYHFTPRFGELVSELVFPLTRSMANVFGIHLELITFSSDSVIYFMQGLLLIVPAVIFSIVISKTKLITNEKWSELIHTSITFFLAFFLLKYGADKIFKHQFYDAEPNILFTPVGHLSKDILFWTSMGSSYTYNLFMGIIEIIPAILLLWRKTRLLGAIISVGVLGNVLVLNFSFDITVKLLSSLLFFSSIFVLSKYFKLLWSVFISHQTVNSTNENEAIQTSTKKRVIKGGIIALFVIETFLPVINSGNLNDDNSFKIAYFGAYNIENKPVESVLFRNAKRMYIHSKGYLIIETIDQIFKDYPISSSTISNEINLFEENIKIKVIEKNGYSILKWSESNTNYLSKITKIELDSLPVMKDEFNWFLESQY